MLVSPLRVVASPRQPFLVLVPPPLSADDGRARTGSSDLPSAYAFIRAFLQRLLEIRAGVRPAAQLQPDTSPELFAVLEVALVQAGRPGGTRPRPGAVRSVHVQQRPEGVAEACATVRHDGRVTAVAMRLEGVEGRWRCCALVGI